jgi:hypothetical protein
LLTNIRKAGRSLEIYSNGGSSTTDLIGNLAGFKTVWYQPDGIDNILSLASVQEEHHVTYDSQHRNKFMVERKNGTVRKFKQSEQGLYYSVMDDNDFVLVSTVANNKTKYSPCDYSCAVTARNLHKTIGHPSLKAYLDIVDNNCLINCPITRDNIIAAEDIFGPEIGCLQGKTVCKGGGAVRNIIAMIPPSILDKYKNITLVGDVMHVNKIRFLTTMSFHIKFITSENITNSKKTTLIKSVQQVNTIYQQHGFCVVAMHFDGEFEPMQHEMAKMKIHLNICSEDEHVHEIERMNHTIKERVCGTFNSLPIK